MKNLKIRSFEEKDYNDALRVGTELIGTKMIPYTNFTQEKAMDFIKDTKTIPEKAYDGYIVAALNQKVVGILQLKYRGQKKQKEKLAIPGSQMLKKYGFLNTIRLSYVGFIFNHKVSKNELYIDNVVVSEKARGMGIGTLLLEEAINKFKKGPFRVLSLKVLSSNKKAIKLYERNGFKIIKTTDFPKGMQKRFNTQSYHYMTRRR